MDESSSLFTATKDGMWGPLSTGDLSLYRAKIHFLYCLANSFFYHDKSIWPLSESISDILPLTPNFPIFISFWQRSLLIYLFMQLLWYITSFAHSSPVSFRNMSPYWNLQLSTTCQLPLRTRSEIFSYLIGMVTNDARFVSRIWGCYCFGSHWSGNRRGQWWKIEFFRFSFCCSNFVSCSFLLVRIVVGFDVISYIGYSILINISNWAIF